MRKKKKIIIILSMAAFLFFASPINVSSQNWGVSIGASTESVVLGDVFFEMTQHIFHVGGSYSINNQFNIFSSYNTIRKLSFGIRFNFKNY